MISELLKRSGLALALLLATVCTVMAQTAQVTGRVTDTSGGVVVGTEVVVTNMGTGLRWEVNTNDAGYYTAPLLPPGKYQILAQKQGFKPVSRSGITLQVGQVARIDFILEVGAVSETVSVTGEIPRIETEQATLGTVVERQRVENLPLNGRNVVNLIKLVGGIQPTIRSADGFAQASEQSMSQIRFNGGPVYGNQVFFDGGTANAQVHHEVGFSPMLDTVQEFRVETNSLKAEYGQTSGGIINLVTKAGTNSIHGSLYEFGRNDALDARNAFATQRDSVTGRIKQVLRYHQFGGTVGGPVWIPGVLDGRNRTFFFAGYEQWRQITSPLRQGTVPTLAERSGDFTRSLDARGSLISIYDPSTTRQNPTGSGYVRNPFPGNVIPASRFDSASLKVLEFMPLPNAAPIDRNTNSLNFLALASYPMTQGTSNFRVDHRVNDRHSLFFRYAGKRNARDEKGWGLGVADPEQLARLANNDSHNWILAETATLSPSIINEFRANLMRMCLSFIHPSYNQNWPSRLGLSPSIPQDLFPRVEIAGELQLGTPPFANGARASHTLQVTDSVTITRGRHLIKAGMDHRLIRLNWVNFSYPSGQYVFSTSLTNNPQLTAGTGTGMATFLLGEVSSGVLRTTPFYSFQAWSNGSFIQDDFKIAPRLTLNLGLRYDIQSAPVERHNRYSNFNPMLMNSATGRPGTLTYAGVTSPRSFVDGDYNNFGPRFGFAYSLTRDGKTAVRGGYGVIYMLTFSGDTQGDASNSLGFQGQTDFVSPIAGPYRAFQFSQGPGRIVQPLGAAGGPSAYRGSSVVYQDRNAPAPYLQQWNLTFQRDAGAGWTLSVSYAGNRGVKLFGGGYNLNQIDPKYLALGLTLQDQVANPFVGQIANGSLASSSISRSQSLLPLPDYLNVNMVGAHSASSTYHSLQATVEKKYAKGLTALVSYTNGKLIDDATASAGSVGGMGDFRIGRYNRRLDRSIDSTDIPQRMVISGVYELPFGTGRHWLSHASAPVRQLAGGWQLNAITTLESGQPLSVRGASNFSGINWPDMIGDPTLPSSERAVTRWFNADAFRNPANFTIGNVGRTLPATRGPGLIDMSFSVFKVVRIRERMQVEVRAESFNALNHVNLNNPNTSFTPNSQGMNSNATFGRCTSALEPRRMQFGMRLTF
jgi:hypothetical protein